MHIDSDNESYCSVRGVDTVTDIDDLGLFAQKFCMHLCTCTRIMINYSVPSKTSIALASSKESW